MSLTKIMASDEVFVLYGHGLAWILGSHYMFLLLRTKNSFVCLLAVPMVQ